VKQWTMRTIRQLMPLSWLLTVMACSYVYGLTNGVTRPLHTMELWLDRMIPFNEYFIIPYIVWGPCIFLSFVFFFFKNRDAYYRMIITSVIGHIFCYVFYMTYQTYVPRPFITDDTIFLKLVNYIYSNDQPVNAFPSIHVLTTYLMMRAYHWEKLPKLYAWIPQFIGLSIILSTVFVKQHVVIDIAGAIVLGETMILLVYHPAFGKQLFALRGRGRDKSRQLQA
jgi:membrane-associated phospholipid phosphatase